MKKFITIAAVAAMIAGVTAANAASQQATDEELSSQVTVQARGNHDAYASTRSRGAVQNGDFQLQGR